MKSVGTPILDIGRVLSKPSKTSDTRRERIKALAKEFREAKDEETAADVFEALLNLKDSES